MSKNIKVPPPPIKKGVGKGAPPTVEKASKNLIKPMEGDQVAFNFRVPSEFRKQVRQYALDHDTTAVQVMMDAMEEYMNSVK